jgi:hypothetical protein
MGLTYDLGSLIQAAEGIVGLALGIVTAICTYGLVREARNASIAQLKPNVAVVYERDKHVQHYYNLVVKNFGPGVACNIKLSVDGCIMLLNIKHLNDSSMFKYEIPFLGVSERLQTAFGAGGSSYDKANPDSFTVKVVCLDVEGRKYSSDSVVNRRLYDDIIYLQEQELSLTEDDRVKRDEQIEKFFKELQNQQSSAPPHSKDHGTA